MFLLEGWGQQKICHFSKMYTLTVFLSTFSAEGCWGQGTGNTDVLPSHTCCCHCKHSWEVTCHWKHTLWQCWKTFFLYVLWFSGLPAEARCHGTTSRPPNELFCRESGFPCSHHEPEGSMQKPKANLYTTNGRSRNGKQKSTLGRFVCFWHMIQH